jgi:serine-threonine kinase receptor-associated protein
MSICISVYLFSYLVCLSFVLIDFGFQYAFLPVCIWLYHIITILFMDSAHTYTCSCRLDPSGGLAATASGDFSVRVWDAITGHSLCEWKHGHILKTCDFSPNAQRLATGGHEGILRVYPLTKVSFANPNNNTPSKQQQKNNNKSPAKPPALPSPQEWTQLDSKGEKAVTITKCLWISDSLIVTGGADGCLRVWQVDDATTHKEPTRMVDTKSGAEIRDLEIVDTILTVASGKTVYFYQLPDLQLIRSHVMPIHFQAEGGASLHPKKDRFVAGGSDLWVRVFDYETGQMLECHKGHHGPIRCLRYSPDGESYASGSEDGTIRLWQTNLDGPKS